MSEVTLVAETGRTTGSPESRRLRTADRIPAVVYGNGVGPISVSVARRDLRIALTGPAGNNAVINLNVDGKVHPSVVKEIQRDKVRRTVNHVDFLVVNLANEIDVEVPVVLVGEAKAVAAEGGLVDASLDTMTVTTTPRNIPNEISIDISDMTIDSVIRVADIKLPAGVTTPLDPETAVVSVLLTRAAAGDSSGDADGDAKPAE